MISKDIAANAINHLISSGYPQRIGRETEYVDKNGKQIRIGDLVDFYFNADCGRDNYSEIAHSDFSLMEDMVIEIGDEVYFFDVIVWGGGFAHRAAAHCEVKGSIDFAAVKYDG